MKRKGNVVTKVGRWQQRSLFTSDELRRYRKDRYRDIRQRLRREKERDEPAKATTTAPASL